MFFIHADSRTLSSFSLLSIDQRNIEIPTIVKISALTVLRGMYMSSIPVLRSIADVVAHLSTTVRNFMRVLLKLVHIFKLYFRMTE